MTLRVSEAVLNARYDGGVMQYLDTGSEPARLRIYSGTKPATLGGTITGTLLHEVPFTKPCGTVADGVLSLEQGGTPLILATGNASWAMIVNGNTAVAMDMNCSLLGEGGECQMPTLSLYEGGTVIVVLAELG